MRKTVWFAGGAAVLLVGGVSAFFLLPSRAPTEPAPAKAAGMAASLGIPATAAEEDPEKAEQRELEMLQTGEAARSVEREIDKAEALLQKHQSGSDQHRMLSRRLAMLKRLKEKMPR
ncbi:MAG: hypothetical protein HY897_26040 [Deltaproteobacteria bacterium]|nr:hypothetical protein [Deltaproteobacteria bacterium]